MDLPKMMIAAALMFAGTSVAKQAPACTSIADTLRSHHQLSELEKLLTAFDIAIREDGTRQLTVFAPTNSAIHALTPEQLAGFQQDPVSFAKVVGDHLVKGGVYDAAALSASDGRVLPTVAGTSVTVEVAAGEVMIQGPNDGSVVTVTRADIHACDAVIHFVDAVILEGAEEEPARQALAAGAYGEEAVGAYGEEAVGAYGEAVMGAYGEDAVGAYGADDGQAANGDRAAGGTSDLSDGATPLGQQDTTTLNGRSSPKADTSSAGAIAAGAVAAVMVAGLAGVAAVVVVKRKAAGAAPSTALTGSTI